MNIEEVEAPKKPTKSTSFIVKTLFRSIPEHRKVWELPGKWTSKKLKSRKKHENYYHAKPVSDPVKSTAVTLEVRDSLRKMNIEEVEEPEATKIHRQNPFTPVRDTSKLRKFTDKTNMQARNHENSDGFCPAPPSGTPAFSITVRTPSVNHAVWGITVRTPCVNHSVWGKNPIFWGQITHQRWSHFSCFITPHAAWHGAPVGAVFSVYTNQGNRQDMHEGFCRRVKEDKG